MLNNKVQHKPNSANGWMAKHHGWHIVVIEVLVSFVVEQSFRQTPTGSHGHRCLIRPATLRAQLHFNRGEQFKAEVHEAIDDTSPTVPHDEAMRQVRAAI